MSYEQIRYQVEDNLLTIAPDRPDKLNAFTNRMMHELIDAFGHADADDSVRAIIVTGAGRAFCAGADLAGGGATFDRTAGEKPVAIDEHRDGAAMQVSPAREHAVSCALRTTAACWALLVLTLGLGTAACERSSDFAAVPGRPTAAPRREPLAGGPYPAILVTQAQFTEKAGPDGKKVPVPGAAKLLIVRKTDSGWKSVTLEDPDSNAFHKALPYDGGILTIGATRAMLKSWRFTDLAWQQQTHWAPTFGGKFDRLRDLERGDVDGDGKEDLVIATHDQGVVAALHPDRGWRLDEIDRQPDTFVHEIEIGDVDGDGVAEFFATPSKPNKLDEEQPGEVTMYRHGAGGWRKSVVDAPGDTHAKEILAADIEGDGVAELFVVWEGAVGPGGQIVRPVTVKEYKLRRENTFASTVVGTIPDRQMRSLAAADVNGDGKIDLVGGAFNSGLWLFEREGEGWTKTLIDAKSSGFEHPVHLADLDGDGTPEIYVASEDQNELRQYRWKDGKFVKEVLIPLTAGDITWNLTDGRF